MGAPKSICIEVDNDNDQRETLMHKAMDFVREIAAKDPDLARRGFVVTVSDDNGKLLFEMTVSSKRERSSLH